MGNRYVGVLLNGHSNTFVLCESKSNLSRKRLIITWMSPLDFSLFHPHLSLPSGLMEKVPWGTCLPVVHVLSGVDFHSPRTAHYIDCEMTTLPIARSQRQPPEVALFLWGPARHLVAGGWWLLPIMERMTLCSPWYNYSGYRFAFPPYIVSAKAMCDFQNARYVMVLHATLLLTRQLVSHK